MSSEDKTEIDNNYKIEVLIPIARYPPPRCATDTKSSTTPAAQPFRVQIKSAANIKDFPYLDFKPTLFGETLYSSHKYELLLTPVQPNENIRIFLLRDSNQERVQDGVQIQRQRAVAEKEVQVRIKLQVSSYFYFQEAFRIQILVQNVVRFVSDPFQVFARKRKDVADPWKKNYPEKRKSPLDGLAVPQAKKLKLSAEANDSDEERYSPEEVN